MIRVHVPDGHATDYRDATSWQRETWQGDLTGGLLILNGDTELACYASGEWSHVEKVDEAEAAEDQFAA